MAHTSLGKTVDWIQVYHPIMSESGVFFYPKSEKRNVNTEIIREYMLDARTVHKQEKFEAMKRGDLFTAAVKDLQQGNDKKAANSGYGAEGQASSFLFDVQSAMSVTAAGRGQLSTMILCFEDLFEDNVKFWNMDEFYGFISNIVAEKKTWEYNTFDIVNYTPPKDVWVERFLNKFYDPSLYVKEDVERTYDILMKDEIARTYYKSNIRGFLRWNRVPSDLLEDIAFTDVEYIDPNVIPKEIKDKVVEFVKMTKEFVGYKYGRFRYEDRARYMRRRSIIISDTDS